MSTAALSRRRNDVIPSETITHVTDQLREHGRMRRAYLGVSVQPVTLPSHAAPESGQSHGLMVAGMEDGAPAAGTLALGDVLLSLDGESLDRPAALMGLIADRAPGTRVAVEVLRGGVVHEVQVELGVRR
jgi:serine protease Do